MNKNPLFILLFFIFSSIIAVAFTNMGDESENSPTTKVVRTEFGKYIDSMYSACGLKEEGMNKGVFEKAITGFFNMKGALSVAPGKSIVSIVDFTKKSTDKRLWVIDLSQKKLLFHSMVAHGRNTGEQYATCFSNECSSNMSSLGFYVTGETYDGKHGLSLAIDGLDKGFNDNARERAVVIHAADYVSEDFIKNVGRIGRSLGCPALPSDIAPEVINTIANGTCLFLYYPDKKYERSTSYYNTATAEMAFNKDKQLGLLK